jgi:predicted dehydrogenase
VLGAARIALEKVIPAMQQSPHCRIVGMASRDPAKGRAAADELGIARVHDSYEALIADPEIEAIYNPLPNHLHVPWTIRAAEQGKHVLCEKPIALSAAEARELLAVRERTGVRIGEAFMVRTHPQWLAAREIAGSDRIGELRLITGHFSYYRRDPADIRSRVEWGGGALMDIGCYPIMLARWLFDAEPLGVVGVLERDPDLGIDRLGSAVLDFPAGQASITFAGQLVPYQRVHLFGTLGRIEIEIPFNAPPDRRCRIFVDDGRDLVGGGIETIEFPAVNQYTLQGEAFSRAIRGLGPLPMELEDSIANMAVMDALFRSAESHGWEVPARS